MKQSRRQFLKIFGLGAIASGCGGLIDINQDPDLEERTFLPVTIEHVDDADLSNVGLSAAEKAVYIHSSLQDAFDLGTVQTNELWVASTINGPRVFYRDKESVPDIKHHADIEGGSADLGEIVYKGERVKMDLAYAITPSILNVVVYGDREHVNALFQNELGGFRSLGQVKSLEEEHEVGYIDQADFPTVTYIGTLDTDFEMRNGILVRKPKTNGASDQVVLGIPSELRQRLAVTIEHVDDADLEAAGQGMSSCQKAVYIHAPGNSRFALSNGKQTSELWLVPDANQVKVFYKDVEQIPDTVYAGTGLFTNIIYKDNQNTSLEWRITLDSRLMVYLETGVNVESLESHFNIVSGEVNSLGDIISLEEPNELIYKKPGQDNLIGLMNTDFEMDSGVVVKNPKTNGASDQVVIEIPSY